MNYRMTFYIMGQIMKVVGAFMLLPVIVGAIYGEEHVITSFGIPFLILMLAAVAFTIKKPKNRAMYSTESFVSVAGAWIAVSAVGALPFVISGEIPSYVDALFETVSGFTTTGSTILTDVESMSRACLFWRSFTQWLGGMGILIFVLAIMSSNDVRTMHMMRAECAGPKVGRIVSKSSYSARILYGIYIGLTAVEIIFLLLGGMPLFDSLIHTFGTAGTGGFSMYASNVGHYNSLYIEMVIAVFSILFGINFNIFFYIIIRKFALAFKNEELRVYFGIIISATLIIALNLYGYYEEFGESLRHSFFMVAAMISSAGFTITDYTQWPVFSQMVLLMLMFVGACAGSTGGGLKVSRIIILFKTGIKELKYIANPRAVATVKLDGKPVEKDVVRGTTSYVMIFLIMMMISVLLFSLDKYSIAESATAVFSCISNMGYGVGSFGPSGNFSGISNISKIVLMIDMFLGRLEIYPLIMLFTIRKK